MENIQRKKMEELFSKKDVPTIVNKMQKPSRRRNFVPDGEISEARSFSRIRSKGHP